MQRNTESNGRFHTDWLNMIYPRLKVAKNLLSEDGAIFIHIDEHEVYTLSMVCNEIFGKQNELGTIIWDKRNPKGDAQGISYQHEYIVIYAKNKLSFIENNKLQIINLICFFGKLRKMVFIKEKTLGNKGKLYFFTFISF